jgi:hypothetical protein
MTNSTMTMEMAAATAATSASLARRPWRLAGGTRKALLVVHIAAAGTWIGMDIVMGVLVFTAMLTDDPQLAGLTYQALELFAVWPIVAAGLLCLASGVVLGLGSKYGLVRYWWVAVKLVMNIVLCALVVFALRPGVYEVAAYGRELVAGTATAKLQTDIMFPPIVSTTALLIAVVLSVFKPWGRIGKARPEGMGRGKA